MPCAHERCAVGLRRGDGGGVADPCARRLALGRRQRPRALRRVQQPQLVGCHGRRLTLHEPTEEDDLVKARDHGVQHCRRRAGGISPPPGPVTRPQLEQLVAQRASVETAVDPDSAAHADRRMAVSLCQLAAAAVAAGVAREAGALPAAHHGGTSICCSARRRARTAHPRAGGSWRGLQGATVRGTTHG